ncbi:hypothetical protein C8J56DRAFT_911418 [Mycena floridula]|nr:hypothetical protein C8J56DRAFT_911418 [Mycena floridula]
MDVIISEPSPDKIKVLARAQYDSSDSLSPANVASSPLDQFRTWFKDAIESRAVAEPEAMSLSTATCSGIPSARMVLFKELDNRGFIFFTNYTSRKSQELIANPHAALVFYWREIHKSVRILGSVEKLSSAENEAYFKTRPLGSRLGAWASKQSTIVEEGEVLARLKVIEDRFSVKEGDKDGDIPVPDFWGGWRVVPNEIEFWCGKPSRLHDRVTYIREGNPTGQDSTWTIKRLAP